MNHDAKPTSETKHSPTPAENEWFWQEYARMKEQDFSEAELMSMVIGLNRRSDRLVAQRDELLAACNDIREPFLTAVREGTRGLKDFDPASHSCIVQLDKAIANAEQSE